jgi:hypothetical protein
LEPIHPPIIHPSIHPSKLVRSWALLVHWWPIPSQSHMECPMKWYKTTESTLQYLQNGKQLKNSFTKYYYSPRKQGVCHSVALPFTLTKDLKAKEELWKLKYFTMQKYTNLQKLL